MTKPEWHRADNGSTLLYTLRQDGWRKGQPIMINDVMIRIEKTNGSETDLEPIIEQVLSALNGHEEVIVTPCTCERSFHNQIPLFKDD